MLTKAVAEPVTDGDVYLPSIGNGLAGGGNDRHVGWRTSLGSYGQVGAVLAPPERGNVLPPTKI